MSISKDSNQIEIERLTHLEQQVIADLREKRDDDAIVLLNGLNYSISWAGKDDSIAIQSWRSKKNGYIQTINQLKNR